MTAKSTGTRDRNEATRIASRCWTEYDKTGAVSYKPSNSMMDAADYQMKALDEKITAYTQTAIDTIVQSVQTVSFNKNTLQPYSISAAEYEDAPEEVKPLLDRLSTLTFYEYVLLYWNYNKSPYIKEFTRTGEKPPNPERFKDISRSIKKYAHLFPQCLLTEITGTKIDTLLGAIKKEGKLKDNTIKAFRYIFSQSLSYAYRHNLLARDVSQQISHEAKSTRKKAKKEAEKAIFTKEEIQRLFNSDDNPFVLEVYKLINELLLKTGCRIGELQALQIQDFIKNADGYALKIDKNYCRAGKRIKCTKTERSDTIPISNDLAAKLLAYLEKHPLKDKPDAFIFFSAQKSSIPISYAAIRKNFIATMKRLKFARANLTLHSYRHTFATFLRLAGFSEEELKFLTRHDCIAEVRRYTDHYTPEMEQLKHKAVIVFDTLTS